MPRVVMVEQGGRGGVADYTEALTAALAAAGAEVQLLTARDHLYRDVPGREVVPRVFYLRERSRLSAGLRRARLGKAVNGLAYLAVLPWLWRAARRADVVHLQAGEWPPLIALTALAGRLAGRPVVWTVHNTFQRGERQFGGVEALTRRLSSRVIVHSRWDMAQLEPAARPRTRVIAHGEYSFLGAVEPAQDRAAARAALEVPPDAPAVLLFGQLRADKGIGDLLAAAREVPEVHVLLVGQDTGGLAAVRPDLDALGLRCHLVDRFVSMEEAAGFFAAADAVVLPYPRASASGVLLLAYGFRRPAVAYPVGGLPEYVVDGRTGWLCRAPSPEALAEALRAVADAGPDERARRGEAARAFADEHLAWPAIAARTSELYAEVVRGS